MQDKSVNVAIFVIVGGDRPGGVLAISSDGDDRRIFFRFEIFYSGIFLGTKIWLAWVA